MTSTSHDSTVALAAEQALLWREWDDGCAVYNRATGETHFFDLWTSYLLRVIERGPVPEGALADILADELVQDLGPGLTDRIHRTVDNFSSMALVVRCPVN
ncbi:MAG: HPr-rel-A system PqqD family peptide chaperone [Alphaproteobacteria bacterium]